tara:strand:- start:267 stop:896 length:630 start_codon:yes stop_codon:yes gene_type:complete
MAYSTCIARVFFNIRESRIRGVFRTLNIGEIDRIDMIKKTGKDKKNFWCVFIHWSNLSEEVRSALNQKDGVVTIEYDEPWYWKMTKSHARKPVRRAAPTLSIGGVKTQTSPPPPRRQQENGWVNVPKGGSGLRTETPYTPSATTAPTPPVLERKPSSKDEAAFELSDNSDAAEVTHDRALQPDEELRGAAMQWAREQAEGGATKTDANE